MQNQEPINQRDEYGKRIGTWKTYGNWEYVSHKLIAGLCIGNYVNGMREGYWEFKTQDGTQLVFSLTFKNDKIEGIVNCYDAFGSLLKEVLHIN